MAELWEQIPENSRLVLDSYFDHYAIQLPDVVHTSKNETIGGNKTFTGTTKFTSTTQVTGSLTVPTRGTTDNSTYAANTAYCMAGKRKLTTPSLTQLWKGNKTVGAGNITLSQSWKNFDELIVFAGNDSANYVTSWRIETWELQKRIDLAVENGKNQFGLFYGSIYWHLSTTSTNTSWVSNTENCALYAVYGVNFKFPKYA